MENEKKEVTIENGGIDKEVLEAIVKNDVLSSIQDQKQINRVVLNCLCEFLSELMHLNKSVDSFLDVLTICGSDKLQEFFTKFKSNVEEEQNKDVSSEENN